MLQKKLLFVLISFSIYGHVLAQEPVEVLVSEECFEYLKKDKDYIISVNGVHYEDLEKVFICESDLPLSIELYYKDSMKAVISDSWDYEKCTCNPNVPNDFSSMIDGSNFQGNKSISYKVKFRDKWVNSPNYDDKITLKLKKITLIEEIELDSCKNHMMSSYSFDLNNYPAYPDSIYPGPWKIVIKDSISSIYVKGHKNILESTSFFDDYPSKLNYTVDERRLDISYSDSLAQDSLQVYFCDSSFLTNVDVYGYDTLHVIVYSLCEGNDDYENYCVNADLDTIPYETGDYDGSLQSDCITPIDTHTFECINRGLDGTLDLFLDHWPNTILNPDRDFWLTTENDSSKPRDKYWMPQISLGERGARIFPSIKIDSNNNKTYFCNNRVQSKPTLWNEDLDGDGNYDTYVSGCAGMPPMNDIINNLNTIYNKVGVYVDVTYGGRKVVNFDLRNDIVGGEHEQAYLHVMEYGIDQANGKPIIPDTTIIWYSKSIDNHRGLATMILGEIVNTANVSQQLMVDRTIAHEVGHAKFKIYHPDVSDGTDIGWKKDGLFSPFEDDMYNLMNSGYLYLNKTTHNINEFKIRRYQWKKIKKAF